MAETSPGITGYNAVIRVGRLVRLPACLKVCIEDQPEIDKGPRQVQLRSHVIQASVMGMAVALGRTVRFVKPLDLKRHYGWVPAPKEMPKAKRYRYNKQWAVDEVKRRFPIWYSKLDSQLRGNDHVADAKLLAEYYANLQPPGHVRVSTTEEPCAQAEDASCVGQAEGRGEGVAPSGSGPGGPADALVPGAGLEGTPLFQECIEPGAHLPW